MEANKQAIVVAGWVFGNTDEFAGERIYPSWQGMLEGKRLICRDVRLVGERFIVHNPWTDTVVVDFGTNLERVEEYILAHGKVAVPGANVWD